MATNNNETQVDFRNYVQPTRMSAHHASYVAGAMEAAMPADADPHERAAMASAVAAAAGVREVLSERDRFSAARVRPALAFFGSMWAMLGEMIAALARLPAEHGPRGPRAAAIALTLLPEGVSFVKLDAGAAWAEGKRRLHRIETEGMATELEGLVGADVLRAVRAATTALGEAVGAGPSPREIPSGTALQEALTNFSRNLAAYCRVLAGKVDETSAASVERFRRAVAPLDEYRAARAARGGSDDDEEEIVSAPVGAPIAPGLPGSSPFITGPNAAT